jgi:hypothetical protein
MRVPLRGRGGGQRDRQRGADHHRHPRRLPEWSTR